MSCDTLCVCPGTRHCPRYQEKRPSENPPGAVFMPDGNTFGNIRNANDHRKRSDLVGIELAQLDNDARMR